MNKLLNILMLISLAAIVFFSCVSDNVEEYYGTVDCESANITFSETIEPIINTNCAVSGCHVSGTGLPSWESYKNIAENADEIARRTSLGIMPPASSGLSLTNEEVQQIQCWVESGAQNN